MSLETTVDILLVDDHPENLLALEAILQPLGQRLVLAKSGTEALRYLLRQDFAVILLDVQMPEIDGFETAALIRERERSRNTPIIFLTAFSTNDNLQFKGYSLGAVDYLLKPINPKILLSKVSVFVELHRKTLEIQHQANRLQVVNAELQASEERFRCLCACSPVGIFMTDLDGYCTYTNRSCQTIAGFTLEDSLGQGWLQSVHPDDRDQIIADWTLTTQKARPYAGESRFLHPDGAVRWAFIRSSPILSDGGNLIGHVGTVEDITEHKQAEQMREQMLQEQIARRQAEEANRMKDEFLGILSHELRTPLNAILGWSKILRTRQLDETKVAHGLETIERNAKSQAQLIEDILDISRIIVGKIRLLIRPVNPVTIVDAAIDVIRPALEAKAIQLTFIAETSDSSSEGASPRHLLVAADPDRLQQILWNLLTNAVKFTPTGGQVEVRIEVVQGNCEMLNTQPQQPQLSNYVRITISDTGIGIAPDFLPYVFERFQQADSSATRSYNGLGLGLAIVRHLVELHGGRISVTSEGQGKGAAFTVCLPLMPENSADSLQPGGLAESRNGFLASATEFVADTAEAFAPRLQGLHLLLVDDEPDAREFLAVALEAFGATVTTAASAKEAIAILQQSQLTLDVLISDIAMPEEDGHMLIRQVRTLYDRRGRHLPAIAVTAYVREVERTLALASGFDLHLSKPVEVAELVTAILNLTHLSAQESLEESLQT